MRTQSQTSLCPPAVPGSGQPSGRAAGTTVGPDRRQRLNLPGRRARAARRDTAERRRAEVGFRTPRLTVTHSPELPSPCGRLRAGSHSPVARRALAGVWVLPALSFVLGQKSSSVPWQTSAEAPAGTGRPPQPLAVGARRCRAAGLPLSSGVSLPGGQRVWTELFSPQRKTL